LLESIFHAMQVILLRRDSPVPQSDSTLKVKSDNLNPSLQIHQPASPKTQLNRLEQDVLASTGVFFDRPLSRVDAAVSRGLSITAVMALGGSAGRTLSSGRCIEDDDCSSGLLGGWGSCGRNPPPTIIKSAAFHRWSVRSLMPRRVAAFR
jgi:hypothetical protein